MQKIEVKSIVLNNFQSYCSETFTFPDSSGFYFIKGENLVESCMGGNASGKTGLIDGLTWGFFGKTSGGFRAGQIVSWLFGKTTASVTIETNVGTLVRTQSPNSITWNGRIIDQTQLDEILGISYEQFLTMVVHGQSLSFFLEQGGAEQGQFLTDIMNLGRFDLYQQKAKEAQKKSQADLLSKQLLVKTLEGQISQVKLLDFEADFIGWEARHEKDLSDLRSRLDAVKTTKESLNKDRDATEIECLEVVKKISELVPPEKDALATLQKNFQSALLKQGELDQHKKEHAKWIKYFTTTSSCTTCLQPIDKKFSDKQIGAFKSNLDEVVEDSDFNEKRKATLQEKISLLTKQEKEYDTALRELQTEKREIEYALSRVSADMNQQTKLEVQIKRDLDKKTAEVNPFSEKAESTKLQLKELGGKLHALNIETDILSKDIEAFGVWVTGFRDIKINQFQKFLGLLEEEANNLLRKMDLLKWEFKISHSTNNAGYTTISIDALHDGKTAPLGRYSGGEGVRLKLVFQMALGGILEQISDISFNIELWDEPLSFLSQNGIDSMLELFKEYAYVSHKQVWLIDHSVLSYGGFDGELLVKKDEGGSHLDWKNQMFK